jgi:alpha-tubulin suppressor-like RCC1 family protein
MVSGGVHSLGIRTDGSLWAWGIDTDALGIGARGTRPTPIPISNSGGHPIPIRVGTDYDWAHIEVGDSHSIGIKEDGSLWTWGNNSGGQLGLGDVGNTTSRAVPTLVCDNYVWIDVSIDGWINGRSFAIREDGTLWAWGCNRLNLLGFETTCLPTCRSHSHGASWCDCGNHHVLTPRQVGTDTWLQVSTGWSHTLAIRTDGTLWSWGSNGQGQLGLGDITTFLFNGSTTVIDEDNDRVFPTQIGDYTDWIQVEAGDRSSFGIREDGSLWAWGDNMNGKLGIGDSDDVGYINQWDFYSWNDQLIPIRVGTCTWNSVATSQSHTLGIRADGSLWSWGENWGGILGLGDDGGWSIVPDPTKVGTHTDWIYISTESNGYTSFGIRADGSLWVWGDNFWLQLGIGIGLNGGENQPYPFGITQADQIRQHIEDINKKVNDIQNQIDDLTPEHIKDLEDLLKEVNELQDWYNTIPPDINLQHEIDDLREKIENIINPPKFPGDIDPPKNPTPPPNQPPSDPNPTPRPNFWQDWILWSISGVLAILGILFIVIGIKRRDEDQKKHLKQTQK